MVGRCSCGDAVSVPEAVGSTAQCWRGGDMRLSLMPHMNLIVSSILYNTRKQYVQLPS